MHWEIEVIDCEGTIYPSEVKTCTVENYIFEKFNDPIRTDGDTADDVNHHHYRNNPTIK